MIKQIQKLQARIAKYECDREQYYKTLKLVRKERDKNIEKHLEIVQQNKQLISRNNLLYSANQELGKKISVKDNQYKELEETYETIYHKYKNIEFELIDFTKQLNFYVKSYSELEQKYSKIANQLLFAKRYYKLNWINKLFIKNPLKS